MVSKRKIQLRGIKQVIENSTGFPFELKVAGRVEAYNDYSYFVEPNYSFEDQDTGEARELDFHATQAISISRKADEYLNIVILGSCKNNANPYIFFTRTLLEAGFLPYADLPVAGFPLNIYVGNEIEDLESYLDVHEILHVGETENIAGQYVEVKRDGTSWKTVKEKESESLFRSICVPLLKVLAREREKHNEECKREKSLTFSLYYPLLVLNGPLLEYHVPVIGRPVLKKTNHLVVVRHHESKSIKCRCAIDVIHESYLEHYLDMLQEEASAFINRVRRHKRIIMKSIKKVSEENGSKSQ